MKIASRIRFEFIFAQDYPLHRKDYLTIKYDEVLPLFQNEISAKVRKVHENH